LESQFTVAIMNQIATESQTVSLKYDGNSEF
jgi:hypothetical protein